MRPEYKTQDVNGVVQNLSFCNLKIYKVIMRCFSYKIYWYVILNIVPIRRYIDRKMSHFILTYVLLISTLQLMTIITIRLPFISALFLLRGLTTCTGWEWLAEPWQLWDCFWVRLRKSTLQGEYVLCFNPIILLIHPEFSPLLIIHNIISTKLYENLNSWEIHVYIFLICN